VRDLTRLIGTWTVTGGATGSATYERIGGGHCLVQRIDLDQHKQPVNGLDHRPSHLFGEEPSKDLDSRFYDNAGNTFDYGYELDGERPGPASAAHRRTSPAPTTPLEPP
jgi:hypothetical protein